METCQIYRMLTVLCAKFSQSSQLSPRGRSRTLNPVRYQTNHILRSPFFHPHLHERSRCSDIMSSRVESSHFSSAMATSSAFPSIIIDIKNSTMTMSKPPASETEFRQLGSYCDSILIASLIEKGFFCRGFQITALSAVRFRDLFNKEPIPNNRKRIEAKKNPGR